MQISSYKKDPQNFLSELDKVELNQLRGGSSTVLDDLVTLLKKENIKITAKYDSKIDSSAFADRVVTDDESLLKKLLAYFIPADAVSQGGIYDSQLKAGFAEFKNIITDAAAAGTREYTLRGFLAMTQFSLTPDRIDDDVIGVMTESMFHHDAKRNALKDQITNLTAELNIYSKITAEISKAQAGNGNLSITNSGLNLMDPKLYGFTNENAYKFVDSAEYKLLAAIRGQVTTPQAIAEAEQKREQADKIQQQLNKHAGSDLSRVGYERTYGISFASDEANRERLFNEANQLGGLTIKQFLASPLKRTGAMTDLSDSYVYDKDNNKLGNFATTVNDRTRPLNDEVNQKTTELNDISSRYNSAIEALNRFIQKYESVMRDILQAI